MIALSVPFVLGLIVRIRSQAADKRKVKANKNSDKVAPSQPSPSSDGEDKPEDSYWTRFKRWCSEHSLAIGLGISFVAAILIYIYREDISNLVYGSQPEEGEEKPKSSEEAEKKQGEETSILTVGEALCNEAFFKEGDDINAEAFVEKAENFRRLCLQIDNHYSRKEIHTEKDLMVNQALAYFKDNYRGLFRDRHSSPKALEKGISYFDSQFEKEPKRRNKNFSRELRFLSRNQENRLAKEDYETFLNIVVI